MKRLGYILGRHSRAAFAAWILFCLAGLSIAGSFARWDLVRSRNTNEAVSKQLGFVGYALFDTYSSLRSWSDERRLFFSDTTRIQSYLDRTRRQQTIADKTTKKNIIYIQMESVDGISLKASYRGEKVMPFLSSLADKSLYFPNTIDNSSSGRTADGEFLALCSLPPVKGKPIYVSYSLDKIPSMPRALKKHGYRTVSLHGHDGKFWNRAQSHHQLGYQESYFKENLDRSEIIGWGISDNSALQQFAAKIKSIEKPVFAHAILLTNHHPYNHVGEKFGYDKGEIVADHVDSLQYVDRSIQTFFETLQRDGLLESSVIAIYSDHDSAIEPKLRKQYDLDDNKTPHDTLPLILYGLAETPRRIKKLTGIQDLPVIILESLGMEIPYTFTGNSLSSKEPSVSPRGIYISLQNGKLINEPLDFDVATLTKLAILHPEALDPRN